MLTEPITLAAVPAAGETINDRGQRRVHAARRHQVGDHLARRSLGRQAGAGGRQPADRVRRLRRRRPRARPRWRRSTTTARWSSSSSSTRADRSDAAARLSWTETVVVGRAVVGRRPRDLVGLGVVLAEVVGDRHRRRVALHREPVDDDLARHLVAVAAQVHLPGLRVDGAGEPTGLAVLVGAVAAPGLRSRRCCGRRSS